MTDKAVIIERMTIELEEIEVKIANLEPRLFERINHLIKQLVDIYDKDENKIYELWIDLNNDFKNLNEQYQDFLKQFHEAKTEELLKSEERLLTREKSLDKREEMLQNRDNLLEQKDKNLNALQKQIQEKELKMDELLKQEQSFN